MNESLIFIETSTLVCSVAISKGESICSERVVKEPKAHARIIPQLLREVITESGITIDECSAVCVSSGPGSYTGLRVGVSFAKGLCYGSGKPLISVSSLELLAHCAINGIKTDILQPITLKSETASENLYIPLKEFRYIVPMIDARRMEVYTALFSNNGDSLTPVEAHIIESDSFSKELNEGLILFCGDGAEKEAQAITHPNARFTPLDSTASGMLRPALRKLINTEFEDVAYFEPFYLKDFIAGISKKRLF